MSKLRWLFTIMSYCYITVAMAANNYDIYHFNSATQARQFDRLTHELRCLVCQNETLADSGAPLAKDLRGQIATQVMSGAQDQQIIDYLVSRYGDFILYRPQLKNITYVLWFAPLLLLILGGYVWWKIVRCQNSDGLLITNDRKQHSEEIPLQ